MRRMNQTASYRKMLEAELAHRCAKNSRYSMRAFASSLGMRPGALSEILNGKRIPSYKMAEKIGESLAFSVQQRQEFLRSLTHTQRARGLKKLGRAFQETSSGERAQTNTSSIDLDLFRIISDWYHYAILELTFVNGFNASPHWISRELGISLSEARLAIERLKSVGLLREENRTLKKTKDRITTKDRHLTTPALRKRQKQILEKALTSLENDPIERRNMSAMTMAIDPKNIEPAKKMIDKFINRLCNFLETGNQTTVYEFGTFLVPLQKTPRGD